MKKAFVIFFIILTSCSKYTVPFETGFTKISDKYQDRNKLIEQIKPNKEYVYWEYVHFTPDVNNGQEIIRKSGNIAIGNSYTYYPPKEGFFVECHPGFCYSYIAYVQNDDVFYITDEVALKKFIGKIDNIEEAILISKINDLWFDPEEKKAGSFKKTNNGFELYMMKYDGCPETKESIKVEIDSTGNFKSKSNGVYYKSKTCIMS